MYNNWMLFTLLPLFNTAIALGGLILGAFSLILFVDYFFYQQKYFGHFIIRNVWPLLILTSLGGTVLSLVYSEYFLFVPCSLCWLQRIALYPQALMALLAFRTKDTKHFPNYGLGLSLFGLVFALYQYAEQMLPKSASGSALPCLVDGSNADCAEKVINLFGFVTFPFIAATSFTFLIALYLYLRRTPPLN